MRLNKELYLVYLDKKQLEGFILPYIVALIIAMIFIFQLFVILFSYGKFADFHTSINNSTLNVINQLQKTQYIQKFRKYSEELYVFAINFFVASTIFTLINLHLNSFFILCLYIISVLLYVISFIIKFKPEIESFEKDYQIEFLIATNVGLIFAFGENLYSYFNGKKDFSLILLVFLVGLVYFYFAERKKHNKTLDDG